MDSHFSHLLLPITLVQDLNKLFFCFFSNVHTECSVRVLAPQERLPALLSVMQITAAPLSSWIDHQLAACAGDNTYEVFLIVPATTAQTRSLRTMFIACQ
jgi:hypothetical protein